jgi:hypothetical protein
MDLEQQMRKDHDELKRIRDRQDYLEKRQDIQSNVHGQLICDLNQLKDKIKELHEQLDKLNEHLRRQAK